MDLMELLWDQYSFNSTYMCLARDTEGCCLLQQDTVVAKSAEAKGKQCFKCKIETEWDVYYLPRYHSDFCNDNR